MCPTSIPSLSNQFQPFSFIFRPLSIPSFFIWSDPGNNESEHPHMVASCFYLWVFQTEVALLEKLWLWMWKKTWCLGSLAVCPQCLHDEPPKRFEIGPKPNLKKWAQLHSRSTSKQSKFNIKSAPKLQNDPNSNQALDSNPDRSENDNRSIRN